MSRNVSIFLAVNEAAIPALTPKAFSPDYDMKQYLPSTLRGLLSDSKSQELLTVCPVYVCICQHSCECKMNFCIPRLGVLPILHPFIKFHTKINYSKIK